ncbi:restriction endonuclease [Longispora sp. NPDC051575]|uniref:restriction endonuclease n=1 Tax=Longispora sp. NPDC051575 TaxID=3154943 RepID=UPI0034496824
MATRRRRKKVSDGEAFTIGLLVLIGAGAVWAGLKAAGQWVGQHSGLVVAVVVLIVAALAGLGAVAWQTRRARTARAYELTLSIAATDGMSGIGFEEWTATLMRRTGFTRVSVCGGTDDQGADIIAHLPGGEKVVVQCKRYAPGRTIGSPVVHQFNGTAKPIHRADVAAIVTTAAFTAPAARDATRLGITLVDRTALAAWAADGTPPSGLRLTPARTSG